MMPTLGSPFPCKTCGTQLVFRTDVSLALACPVCQTVTRRAEGPGTVSSIAPSPREVLSIFQVGTRGKDREMDFEVIGRIQYFFSEGYRNHWFLLYKNGNTGWLGDWAGSLSLFGESTYTGIAAINGYIIGEGISVSGLQLELEVRDQIKAIFWEGEVPEQGLLEVGYTAYEMYSTDGQMGLVHFTTSGKPHAFLGRYFELEQLQLQNVRAHHDWL
ncbi:MAG: hypothetical protein ACO1OQ_06155 [Rufibacter sp.]